MTDQEFKKILLEVHNEYKKHSANWGKSKEINEICRRTGVDRKTAKKALHDMEHPWEYKYLQEDIININKKRGEEKEEEKIAKCPKCRSTSISYLNKVSVGRAIIGGALAGSEGAVLGGLTGKKGYAVCLNCGKRWKV